jgi:hypothetical protein
MSRCSGTGNCAGAARGRTWCGSGWRNWLTNFSQSPVSCIPGQVCVLPSNTRSRSRVRESRSLGSVRGDRGNPVPYREQQPKSLMISGTIQIHRILKTSGLDANDRLRPNPAICDRSHRRQHCTNEQSFAVAIQAIPAITTLSSEIVREPSCTMRATSCPGSG